MCGTSGAINITKAKLRKLLNISQELAFDGASESLMQLLELHKKDRIAIYDSENECTIFSEQSGKLPPANQHKGKIPEWTCKDSGIRFYDNGETEFFSPDGHLIYLDAACIPLQHYNTGI